MLIRKSMSWLFGLVVALGVCSSVQAQHWQPFLDYGHFDYDMQLFAQQDDIELYGGETVQRTGWFGEYARMYINVSKPDYSYDGTTNGDYTWGNRWDLGYMTDENTGWFGSYMHIDGPNANEIVRQQRVNRFNEDDEFDPTDPDDSMAAEPPSDRNNVGLPDRVRFLDVTDSINDGNLYSLELNKLYRLKPLHNGGLLEPFLGVRYASFTDTYRRDGYQRFDEMGQELIFPPFGPTDLPIPLDEAVIEDYTVDRYLFHNYMIGGQLGLRWLHRVNRWNLSSEFRAFGFYNLQVLSHQIDIERTYYDGAGSGAQIDQILKNKFRSDVNSTEFVTGTDIRANAAYELTRDVSLQFGIQFMGFFRGIGRGNDIADNNQDVIMYGGTFGLIWNH